MFSWQEQYRTSERSERVRLFLPLEHKIHIISPPCNILYIFCELLGIFPSPAGARKNTSNEQNVRSYCMLNHRIRGLLFHHKQIVILQLASIFLVRVFRNTLIPSVKMTLTMNKMFAGIICETIEREVDYSTAKKKKCYFGFYFQ